MKFSKDYQPANRRKPDKITELLKATLQQPAPDTPDATKMQVIVNKLIELAASGNIRAIDIIFDRVEGKPLQQVTIEQTELQLPEIVILPANNSNPPVYNESDIKEPDF